MLNPCEQAVLDTITQDAQYGNPTEFARFRRLDYSLSEVMMAVAKLETFGQIVEVGEGEYELAVQEPKRPLVRQFSIALLSRDPETTQRAIEDVAEFSVDRWSYEPKSQVMHVQLCVSASLTDSEVNARLHRADCRRAIGHQTMDQTIAQLRLIK